MESDHDLTVQPFSATWTRFRTQTITRLFQEGIIAGVIGAVTIALWFLILDLAAGRPLYTPTVLGAALFQHGGELASSGNLAVSLGLVLKYSLVHWFAFTIMGWVAAGFLKLGETEASLGFGILLMFVLFAVFEFGFRIAGVALFDLQVHQALTWQKVLVGNLLAAAAMGIYLLYQHRQ